MKNVAKPFVSIIVPVFNAENTIVKTINSIINQSYRNIEVIIVDDGSTDKSFDICTKLSLEDNRLKMIRISNSGVSNARNTGILASLGEYITFVDSDDIIDSNMILNCIKELERTVFEVIIYGMEFIYYKNGKVIKRIEKTIKNDYIITNDYKRKLFIDLYTNNYLSSSCNKLYKKSFLIKNDILFNSNLSKFEDLVFSLKVFRYANNILALNQCFYKYLHVNSMSLSKKYLQRMYEDNIKYVIREMLYLCKELNLSNDDKAYLSYCSIYMLTLCIENEIIGNRNYYDIYKYIKYIFSIEENVDLITNIKSELKKSNFIVNFVISKNWLGLLVFLKIKVFFKEFILHRGN